MEIDDALADLTLPPELQSPEWKRIVGGNAPDVKDVYEIHNRSIIGIYIEICF